MDVSEAYLYSFAPVIKIYLKTYKNKLHMYNSTIKSCLKRPFKCPQPTFLINMYCTQFFFFLQKVSSFVVKLNKIIIGLQSEVKTHITFRLSLESVFCICH
jgi:hypothetical protein